MSAWRRSPLPRLAGFDGEPRGEISVDPMASLDESTLYLRASDEVSYARVLGVVDAARSAGVRRLGLPVEAPR
ncbi:MAG TPA: hypothetical protein VE913_24480 [Longimicrobium sp.]|nr:hypothetical protein [Longimicrobium sp.]